MPELPEVEVVKRSLENLIINLTIKDVEIKETNLRYKVKKHEIKQIIGLKILSIKRKSKYLLFFFNKEIVMLAHLGMTGKFFVMNKQQVKKKTSFYYNIDDAKDKKHDHIIFHFKNGHKLIYNDVRKFGFIKFELITKLKDNLHLKILGPEPLKNSFSYKYFKNYIKGRNRIIKDLLMDQKFVSGLGNIYCNEILFLCRLNPHKIAKTMNKKEITFRDPIVERVVDSFIQRSDTGFKKYGQTLHDERTQDVKGLFKYVNDVQEELMDAILYLQAVKEEIQDLKDDALIRKANNPNTDFPLF